MAGLVSTASEAGAVASEVFTMFTDWATSHPGDSFSDFCDGVEQQLITRKSDEIFLIRQAANDLRDDFNIFIANHSPTFVASDKFFYTAYDSQYTGSVDDGTYALDELFSSAIVTVAINRFDFSSAIASIDSHRESLEHLLYVPTPFEDVTAAYGEMLKGVAQGQGWELTLWEFQGYVPYWDAGATDWPWWDATDIADELNAIGYFNDD